MILSLVLAGCARMAPERVADGVAALTVRDLGGLLVVLNNDATCGFSSPAVDENPVVTGALGEEGTATWTVDRCTIDLGPAPVEINSDCNGVVVSGSGAFTVTARKEVTGQVTGDPATPVIPTRSDAVRFHLDDASFADFVVTKSTSDAALRIVEGSIQAVIAPRLAADAEDGACSVTTPHAEFEEIVLGPSKVAVLSGKREVEVEVAGGRLEATNGAVGDHVNRLVGEIQVWDHVAEIAPPDGLDPDYNPVTFETSYACREGLALPVSFECPLEPKLVENVARLVIKDLALILKTTDLDGECGFDNLSDVVDEFLNLGTLVDLLFQEPQTIEIVADSCPVGGDLFPVFTDCHGAEYFLDGTATVTGTKTVTGLLALADPPLHPEDRQSALIEIHEVLLSEVTAFERPAGADYEPHLTLHNGRLAGVYHPVTGEAEDNPGAYYVVIPVGEFAGVRLFDSDVTLHNGAMRFPMHVDDSDLYAFTGGYLDDTNWLYGTLTVDGTVWEIGGASQPVPLDPEYDQAQFDLSYECIENLAGVVPVN